MSLFQKMILKRWIKELQLNIEGFRRNAKAYITDGGFKEIKETIEKQGFDLNIPSELMKEGRRLELQYAEVAIKLADKYEQLLQHIRREAGIE